MTIDKVNRVLLALFGLVALGFGAWVVARSQGWVGDERTLVERSTNEWLAGRGSPWVWLGVAVLLLIGGGTWLHAQRAPLARRLRRIDSVEGNGDRTIIDTDAAASAFAAEVERLPGTVSAAARLLEDAPGARIALDVACRDGTDLAAIETRIDDSLLDRFLATIDANDGVVEATLHRQQKPGTRVI